MSITTTATDKLTSTSVRFSTYSGAPSIKPSLAPTMESNTLAHPVDSARNTLIKSDGDHVMRSPSIASSQEARSADLKSWAATFDRMSDQRLEKQRFVPSVKKDDEISTNALGAKLERALGRRMSGQDAIFKRRSIEEKPVLIAA